MMKKIDYQIDCYACQHFEITWQATHPRACNAYGFKTRSLPSQVVLATSGQPCLKFSPKRPLDTETAATQASSSSSINIKV
ncbi:hypothetical protein [Thiomicrospira aerophila]|nr:hypothetical protein [Thiomicrospira aerophila]